MTGVQTCALPISGEHSTDGRRRRDSCGKYMRERVGYRIGVNRAEVDQHPKWVRRGDVLTHDRPKVDQVSGSMNDDAGQRRLSRPDWEQHIDRVRARSVDTP